ncbi:MAG: queuosine precursor transporter [Coxiellaceae bacterium]|nr:queuosine precursor transporter [Coxiellaceae bacterium]
MRKGKQHRDSFKLNSKYLLALAVFYVVFCLSADVLAFRFTQFGPVVESGATLLFPLTYLISDIITEVYGYNVAKMLVWLILLSELLFALLLRLVNLAPNASFFHDAHAYNVVINPILHFVVAGIIANIASDFVNIYLISKWKISSKGKYFWLRSIGSTAISEFILVLVVVLLGFSSTLNWHNLIHIMLCAYGLELFYAVIFVWPGCIIAKFLKKSEGLDVYDYKINYNPFRFSTQETVA